MIDVRPYAIDDKNACLALFDSNVPDFFDPTERDLFVDFLDRPKGQYFCIEKDGRIVGCGGFAREERGQARLRRARPLAGCVDQAVAGCQLCGRRDCTA